MTNSTVLQSQEAIERMGDAEIYMEIVQYFMANLDQNISMLAEALESEKMEEATRLAHSFKSNCATIGAEAAREMCASLEQLCRQGNLAEGKLVFATLLPELERVRGAIALLKA